MSPRQTWTCRQPRARSAPPLELRPRTSRLYRLCPHRRTIPFAWLCILLFLTSPVRANTSTDLQVPSCGKHTSSTRVIVDTDIGSDIDDTWALALALASPELDVRLVVSATYNTTERANIVAKQLAGMGRGDIPIGIGPPHPAPPAPGQECVDVLDCHKGLRGWAGDADLRKHTGQVHLDGVAAMAEVVAEAVEDGAGCVLLLALAPPVNLRLLAQRYPDAVAHLQVAWMGGSVIRGYDGSPPPSQEYNARVDVASTRALFGTPWGGRGPAGLRVVPTDVCAQPDAAIGGLLYQRLRWAAPSSAAAGVVLDCYRYWLADRPHYVPPGSLDADVASSKLYDAVTVLAVLPHQDYLVYNISAGMAVEADGTTVPSWAAGPASGAVAASLALQWRGSGIGVNGSAAWQALLVERLVLYRPPAPRSHPEPHVLLGSEEENLQESSTSSGAGAEGAGEGGQCEAALSPQRRAQRTCLECWAYGIGCGAHNSWCFSFGAFKLVVIGMLTGVVISICWWKRGHLARLLLPDKEGDREKWKIWKGWTKKADGGRNRYLEFHSYPSTGSLAGALGPTVLEDEAVEIGEAGLGPASQTDILEASPSSAMSADTPARTPPRGARGSEESVNAMGPMRGGIGNVTVREKRAPSVGSVESNGRMVSPHGSSSTGMPPMRGRGVSDASRSDWDIDEGRAEEADGFLADISFDQSNDATLDGDTASQNISMNSEPTWTHDTAPRSVQNIQGGEGMDYGDLSYSRSM